MYFCAPTMRVRLTLHLANQILQRESIENVKSLPGTTNGIPTNCSSRLNALRDYLHLKKTFQWNKENRLNESSAACFSGVHLASVPVLLGKMGEYPLQLKHTERSTFNTNPLLPRYYSTDFESSFHFVPGIFHIKRAANFDTPLPIPLSFLPGTSLL